MKSIKLCVQFVTRFYHFDLGYASCDRSPALQNFKNETKQRIPNFKSNVKFREMDVNKNYKLLRGNKRKFDQTMTKWLRMGKIN